jgi:hypothetical protein
MLLIRQCQNPWLPSVLATGLVEHVTTGTEGLQCCQEMTGVCMWQRLTSISVMNAIQAAGMA